MCLILVLRDHKSIHIDLWWNMLFGESILKSYFSINYYLDDTLTKRTNDVFKSNSCERNTHCRNKNPHLLFWFSLTRLPIMPWLLRYIFKCHGFREGFKRWIILRAPVLKVETPKKMKKTVKRTERRTRWKNKAQRFFPFLGEFRS